MKSFRRNIMKSVIEAEKLQESLAVLETSKQFDKSIFNLVYDKAAILINQIINSRIEMQNQNSSQIMRNPVENIISFQGRRGTGKTSAMLSVYQALKNRNRNAEWWKMLENINSGKQVSDNDGEECNSTNGMRYSFVVIDYIDASMLERGEDILELIVANMFSKLQQKDKKDYRNKIDYENRRLYEKFANVFDILINVKKNSKINNELSPLQMLAQLSNSQILGSKMEKLVQDYLEYMLREDERYDRDTSYLVIAIDDIDMHFHKKDGSSYELLETLHRYLMIPNVIILVSYDYTHLCNSCEKHFIELYHKKHTLTQDNYMYIDSLTVEYLNKVLPNYTRIHMPSLRKRDYEEINGPRYYVQIKKDDLEKVFDNFFKDITGKLSNQNLTLSVKQFAFLLKASNAGIFYDALGDKRHFADPTTLRELAQTYVFHEHLRTIKKQHSDEVESNNAVYKELLDDLYFRHATEKLSVAEQRMFKNYLDVKIERRSQDIIRDIRNKYMKDTDNDFSAIRYLGERKYSYSMGELLYALYQASSEGIFTKALIGCILESYTIMLTRFYRNYRVTENSTKNSNRLENKKRILKIMGASISSSWSNKLMPSYHRVPEMPWQGMDTSNTETSQIVDFAAVKFTSHEIQWYFEIIENIAVEETVEGQSQSSLDWDVEMLHMIEILCMFFTNIYNNKDENSTGFTVDYRTNNSGNDFGNLQVKKDDFSFSCTDGCFNIMNFVNNLFLGEEYFNELHNNMKEAWTAYFDKKNNSEKFKNDKELYVNTFLEENSLYNTYKEWWNKSFGLALPIYSFDMMYNLFKRCFLNQTHHSIIRYDGRFLPSILHLLENEIGEMLKKESEYYYKLSDNSIVANEHFYSYYKNNPFLQYLKKVEADNNMRLIFETRFKNLVQVIAQRPEVTENGISTNRNS